MVWNKLINTPLLAVLAVAALSQALLHAHHGTAASGIRTAARRAATPSSISTAAAASRA